MPHFLDPFPPVSHTASPRCGADVSMSTRRESLVPSASIPLRLGWRSPEEGRSPEPMTPSARDEPYKTRVPCPLSPCTLSPSTLYAQRPMQAPEFDTVHLLPWSSSNNLNPQPAPLELWDSFLSPTSSSSSPLAEMSFQPQTGPVRHLAVSV
ncbi:hypothetical protein BC629DRAFT_86962 [Irpex lacteus]|nr:hypothetical protein BC629DRAFT_86962 [Irpex lacteus]